MRLTRRSSLGLLAGTAACGLLAPAVARAAVDFSGRTIEWIVPFSQGGGTDVWARFNAPFLSRHLPGQPTVVVKNMPGGGSITGANWFARNARPDGSMLLGTSGSTQFPYLLGDPRVRYDYRDWVPVLVSETGGVAYVKPELGVRGPEDIEKLRQVDLVYASQGPTSLDLVPLLAFELLGLKVRAVFGFKGRGEGRLAYERGEVNIDYQTSSGYLENVVPLVEKGEAVPLFSWGVLDDEGRIVRDPTFPDLPSFSEFYERATGTAPSGTAWDAWRVFFTAGFAAQKMAVLPKETPTEIVEAFGAAFTRAKEDPEYRAGRESVLGTYDQFTGEGALTRYRLAIEVPEEARAWVREWLEERYGTEL